MCTLAEVVLSYGFEHLSMLHNMLTFRKSMQVLFAGSLLKNNKDAHEALILAMSRKASVLECIQAIEDVN